MIVVGLDLSLTETGIAVVGKGDPWTQVIKSNGKADASLLDRAYRLARIVDQVSDVINGLADLVVVEAPAPNQKTGHHHDRSGLWWLVVRRLHGVGIEVAEVSPTTLKKYATGKGNASKDLVLLSVDRRWPSVAVSNNNEADALILAAMGARRVGEPIDNVPRLNLEAMLAVRWPDLPSD